MIDKNKEQDMNVEDVESCSIEISYEPKKILMIVTSTDRFDETHKTGLWFEEFAVPYNKFIEAGYVVTVASLKGGKAPIDPASENLIDDIKWQDAKQALGDTVTLETVDYTLYQAEAAGTDHLGLLLHALRHQLLLKLLDDWQAVGGGAAGTGADQDVRTDKTHLFTLPYSAAPMVYSSTTRPLTRCSLTREATLSGVIFT